MRPLKKVTKEQIRQGNIIIAKRLKWEEYTIKGKTNGFVAELDNIGESGRTCVANLKFHSRFDWLIPVVRMLFDTTKGKLQAKTDLTMVILQLDEVMLFDAVVNFIHLTSSESLSIV